MRVLYLTEEAISFEQPLVRGGAIHVRNVVKGLRDRNFETFLIDWNDTPERSYQHSVNPPTRFVIGGALTARRAIRVGRAQAIDVIVSKTRKTYLAGWLAARRLDIPHVLHVGSSLGGHGNGGLRDALSQRSFRTRLRLPHDGYFTVCEYIADQLRSLGIAEHRVFDLKNAVDTERFHPSMIPTPLDSEFQAPIESIDPDRLRLGFVGGIHRYKGLEDLVAALDRTELSWHLIVAGEGPERARLEAAFGSSATFLGAVPYSQIPALYHEFDVFVLPSRTEGLPRVVLEAQATGTPVVATRVGGVPEIVDHGHTGLLFEPGRPDDLAALIGRLETDTGERDRLARKARDSVERGFTWPELYDRYERYLHRVIR